MSDLNLSSPTSSPSPAPATPAVPTGNSELSELKELCAELRGQTQSLRIALLIVAICLASFFFLESRRSGQSLELLRPQAAQVAEATKQLDPAVSRFLGQLADYAKTHPDFGAILAKYIGRPTGAPAAAPAAAAPAKPGGAAPAR